MPKREPNGEKCEARRVHLSIRFQLFKARKQRLVFLWCQTFDLFQLLPELEWGDFEQSVFGRLVLRLELLLVLAETMFLFKVDVGGLF